MIGGHLQVILYPLGLFLVDQEVCPSRRSCNSKAFSLMYLTLFPRMTSGLLDGILGVLGWAPLSSLRCCGL